MDFDIFGRRAGFLWSSFELIGKAFFLVITEIKSQPIPRLGYFRGMASI